MAYITLHNFLINTGSGYFETPEDEEEQNEQEEAEQEATDEGENDSVRRALC